LCFDFKVPTLYFVMGLFVYSFISFGSVYITFRLKFIMLTKLTYLHLSLFCQKTETWRLRAPPPHAMLPVSLSLPSLSHLFGFTSNSVDTVHLLDFWKRRSTLLHLHLSDEYTKGDVLKCNCWHTYRDMYSLFRYRRWKLLIVRCDGTCLCFSVIKFEVIFGFVFIAFSLIDIYLL